MRLEDWRAPWLSLAACLHLACHTVAGQSFVHPGLFQTGRELEFMRRKVLAREEPWNGAYGRLRSASYSRLDFEPKPIAHIIRGAYGNPGIGDRNLMNSAKAAYSQALQWYITRDPAHARKAGEIIDAWAANLRDFSGNDAKLLAGWTGHDFCNAAEILRYTGPQWDDRFFRKMLTTVYYPLIKDFFPAANGNWDAAMMDTMLCMGVYLDDRAMFQRAVEHFLRGTGNGGIAKYIYPSGQCEESARDQGHTQLGLGEMALACQVAWNQGVDLYGAVDNRLALGFEYTARYMAGGDVPANCKLSAVARGKFNDYYEPVWQHYYFDCGMDLPWVGRAVQKTRRGQNWGALIFYRGSSSKSVKKLEGPAPSPVAESAGTMEKPSAVPPPGAVEVKAGQSIQPVLDAAANGSWVVLDKGAFVLSHSLRVPSGVTLAGQGKETTILFQPAAPNGLETFAIVNQRPDASNIVLRDFVLDGDSSVLKPSPSPPDPNSHRRSRSRPTAPARGGICFAGEAASKLTNVRFEHLTVRHWTRDGVVISNANLVDINRCDINDSGYNVPPGPGFNHNLVFDHVSSGFIENSRLDDSASGSGARIDSSYDIHIFDCELARNAKSGLDATAIEVLVMTDCLAEANDEDGIFVERAGGPYGGVGLTGNISRNNGHAGIRIERAESGYAHDNALSENGAANQLQLVDSPRLEH